MDIDALVAELRDDPLQRGYAEMSALEAAASLSAVNRSRRRLVPNWEIKRAVIEMGRWGVIVLAAQGAGEPAPPYEVRALAINVGDWIDDRTGQIQHTDMDRPSAQAMLTALVQSTLLSQEQADSLAALADETVSRATELGLPLVEEKHVRDARSLINGE